MYIATKKDRAAVSRFARLMDLYEANYINMRLLLPALDQLQGDCVSRVNGCLDLHIRVIEKSPYTSTLNLTYVFTDGNRDQYEPDLYVRVYHDARQAEVVSGLLHGQRHVKRCSRSLEGSWKLNRFLYKWLRYCLRRGHKVHATTH